MVALTCRRAVLRTIVILRLRSTLVETMLVLGILLCINVVTRDSCVNVGFGLLFKGVIFTILCI